MRSIEQTRFLGMALRSLLETVACQQLIRRRGYLDDVALITPAYQHAETLARRIQAMRRAIMPRQAGLGEEEAQYAAEE